MPGETIHSQSANEPGNQTSPTLLIRVRDQNDHDAWSDFVRCYAPHIYGWCRGCRLQESDAADVTQEVLLKLVGAIRSFDYDRNRGSFRGWLKTVTMNTVRDMVAGWGKPGRGSGDTGVRGFLASIADEQALQSLADAIEKSWQEELFAAARQEVSGRVQSHTWQAWQMTAMEQITAAEAARRLNMPVSEVYVARSRVNRMLRESVSAMKSFQQ